MHHNHAVFPVAQQIGSLIDFLVSPERNSSNPASRFIPLDVTENISGFEIKADLPGVKKEDIKLEFKDKTLSIEVESQKGELKEGGHWVFNERFYGRSHRSLRFGDDINESSIFAKYEDGVLAISIAKKPPVAPTPINIL